MDNFFRTLLATTERRVIVALIVIIGIAYFVIPQVGRLQISFNENFAAGGIIVTSQVCTSANPSVLIAWPNGPRAGDKRVVIQKANSDQKWVKRVAAGVMSTSAPSGFRGLSFVLGGSYSVKLTNLNGNRLLGPVTFSTHCETSTPPPPAGDTIPPPDSGAVSVDLLVNDTNTLVWTNVANEKVHLFWKSTNATSCGYKIDSGTLQSVSTGIASKDITIPSGNHTITLTCNNGNDSASDSVRTEQHSRYVSYDFVKARNDNSMIGAVTRMPSDPISVEARSVQVTGANATISRQEEPISAEVVSSGTAGEEKFTSNAWVEGWFIDPTAPVVRSGPNYTHLVAFVVTDTPNSLPTYEGEIMCPPVSGAKAHLAGTMRGFEGDHFFRGRIPVQYLDGKQHYLSVCGVNNWRQGLSDSASFFPARSTYIAKDIPFQLSAHTDLKVAYPVPNTEIGTYSDGPASYPLRNVGLYFRYISGSASSCEITRDIDHPVNGPVQSGVLSKREDGWAYNTWATTGTFVYTLTCTDPFGDVSTDQVTVTITP